MREVQLLTVVSSVYGGTSSVPSLQVLIDPNCHRYALLMMLLDQRLTPSLVIDHEYDRLTRITAAVPLLIHQHVLVVVDHFECVFIREIFKDVRSRYCRIGRLQSIIAI